MNRKLIELVGTDAERPFSPYCWRTRMALAHKGLEVECVPWRFTEKEILTPYHSDKVPVLIDGDATISDSWAIANYLEDTYPEKPSLFGGEGGRAMARMLNWWADATLGAGLVQFVAADIWSHLRPVDQEYFRKTREARFGKTLEEAAATRDERVETFRKSLDPMRLTLRTQPFIGGSAPNYADYIMFGNFQWVRAISSFKVLKEDDLVYAWREKMLDLFGGLARRSPGYPL